MRSWCKWWGFIKHVKPHVRCFTKTKWETKLAEDTLEKQIICQIIAKMTNQGSRCNILVWYHRHGSLEKLQPAIKTSMNLTSVIVAALAELYFLIEKNSVCEIKLCEYISEFFGLKYFIFRNRVVLKVKKLMI